MINVRCSSDLLFSNEVFFGNAMSHSICSKAVRIVHGDNEIKLKKNKEIFVNGAEITSLPSEIDGAVIRSTSSIYVAGNFKTI